MNASRVAGRHPIHCMWLGPLRRLYSPCKRDPIEQPLSFGALGGVAGRPRPRARARLPGYQRPCPRRGRTRFPQALDYPVRSVPALQQITRSGGLVLATSVDGNIPSDISVVIVMTKGRSGTPSMLSFWSKDQICATRHLFASMELSRTTPLLHSQIEILIKY
jgi:hypothetical protein